MTKKVLVFAVFCVVFGLPLAYPLALYSCAWYERWRAERLLAVVTSLHVGATTQAEYDRTVDRLVGSADSVRDGDTNQSIPGAFGITTLPQWVYMSTHHLPEPVEKVLGNWAVVEGTMFEVTPTFKDGKLTAIRISEAQGSGHPFGGFVTIHAGRLQHLFPDGIDTFSGYSGRPMGTDEQVIYTHVDMDDRATPEQRRRALDFRFGCFTALRPCSDGRQLLDPITTDN